MQEFLKSLFPKRGVPTRAPTAREDRDNAARRDVAPSLADDLDYLKRFWPPNDVHDPAAWDTYWSNHREVRWGLALSDMFCYDEEMIAALRANDLRTVLCVGAGVSMEPGRLAAAGFDVTVMDLSGFAMRLMERACAAHPPSPRFVVGDLTDPAVCPGPFDAVIERRTLQLFPEAERPEAIQAVANRLAGRGIFFSHSHDGGWRPPAEPRHFTRSWFEDAGWEIWRQQPGTLRERAAWLFLSTG